MLLTSAAWADSGTLRRSKEGNWSKVRLRTQKGTAWELGGGMGRDYKWGGSSSEGRGKILSVGDSIGRSPRLESGVVRELHGAAFGGDSGLDLGRPLKGRESCPLAVDQSGMPWHGMAKGWIDVLLVAPSPRLTLLSEGRRWKEFQNKERSWYKKRRFERNIRTRRKHICSPSAKKKK
jgi:hypothetical protein